jgi:hypothetical protein
MIDFTKISTKKLCGCDNFVPYYRPLDRFGQLAQCAGCHQTLNLEVMKSYLNSSYKDEIKSELSFLERIVPNDIAWIVKDKDGDQHVFPAEETLSSDDSTKTIPLHDCKKEIIFNISDDSTIQISGLYPLIQIHCPICKKEFDIGLTDVEKRIFSILLRNLHDSLQD